MCTIITLYGVREDFPLVLATNRDEFYARPATGAIRLLADPVTVGGVDLEAGGTWLGVAADGFFVGVTNQRTFASRRSAALSRGQLVRSLLQVGTTAAARSLVAALDPADYNDFNLMFGDSAGVFVAYGRAEETSVRMSPLPVGLHVLPNDELDSPLFPKCARARSLLATHARAPWPALRAALERTLADRHTVAQRAPAQAPPFFDAGTMRALSALCVRTDVYGTRSSTIIALQPGRCAHYLYADGPPGETPFRDVTPLFTAEVT